MKPETRTSNQNPVTIPPQPISNTQAYPLQCVFPCRPALLISNSFKNYNLVAILVAD
jgi:hypothetical protein